TVGWDDGVTRVWDLTTGRQFAALPGHTDAVTDAAFSPDGSVLATTSLDGTLRGYALRLTDLVRIARSRLTRGLTPTECRQYLHALTCPLSARGPVPSPTPAGVGAMPEPTGPEGAYWKVVSEEYLASAGVTPSFVPDNAGTYTLSFAGGQW